MNDWLLTEAIRAAIHEPLTLLVFVGTLAALFVVLFAAS